MYLSDIHYALKAEDTSDLKDINNKLVRFFALMQVGGHARIIRGIVEPHPLSPRRPSAAECDRVELQGLIVAYSLRGCISAELASIGGTFLGIPAWAYQVVPLAVGPMMLMWIGDRITNCGARPFPVLLSLDRLCLNCVLKISTWCPFPFP